jgi:transcriptional regulator with XRE-family HTH domain
MKIEPQLSNEAILQELGRRLAAARLALNLTQAAVAEQAGVGKRTLERMESGKAATQLSSLVSVCRVLGLLERLDALVPESRPGPMAQLKLKSKRRKRASRPNSKSEQPKQWTWGESS